MAQKGKKITPYLSATAGSNLRTWIQTLNRHKVGSGYWAKAIGVTLVSFLSWPFRIWEAFKFNRKLKRTTIDDEPVFILGHWRSGTTLLHYLLGKDPQMGYVSTFQTMFPEYLASEKIYKSVMDRLAPKKRLVDNMKIDTDLPNEEEFGLGNTFPSSFFHCFYFPQEMKEIFSKSVLMEGLEASEEKKMERAFMRLLKKASIYRCKSKLAIKNPANTARIKMILKLFPKAKFIHIYRDPVTVFYSTFKLWKKTIPTLAFQDISEEEMQDNIILFYKLLIEQCFKDSTLIPKENLIEVRFEDFEQDKIGTLEEIYQYLDIPGFDDAVPHFEMYLNSVRGYKKNSFEPDPEIVERLQREWAFAFERLGYGIRKTA